MLDFLSSLGLITWDFDPALIRIGGFELRYYGILFAAALAGGYFMLRWRYKDENEDPETATNLTYAMMIAVIVGTRLVHCLFYDPDFYLSHPIEILKFWKGGLASHGAAVGIILTCILYDYVVRKTPCRITLDRMAFTIPFAMVCIRLGNFFNSEIVGAPCDPNSPLAFIFTRYDMIPRYPSQLFEAGMGLIAGLVIFGTYFYYKKRKNQQMPLGMAFSLILISYFSMRFCVEFFKEYQVMQEGLRMGQILSIPFVVIGFAGLAMCIWGPWKNQTALQYTTRFQLKEKTPEDNETDSSEETKKESKEATSETESEETK